MRRLGIAAVAVVALAGASAAMAAASGWSIKYPKNPSARTNDLHGVSCTSSSACTAVGFYYNGTSSSNLALAERWNGTSWVVQKAKSPAGTQSILHAVACTSATDCVAVGFSQVGVGPRQMLIERWNGKKWSIEPITAPTGAGPSELYGISCTGGKACTAVGYYQKKSGIFAALVEHWKGAGWSMQRTPSSADSTNTYLVGVFCWSASGCIAVGARMGTTTEMTLAERWNGTRWTVQPTPASTASSATELDSVWCASAKSCVATGSDSDALIERWNGKHWSVQANPDSGTPGELFGVSCTSAKGCTAVGLANTSTLAERWDGTTWTTQTTRNPSGADVSYLRGVSCTSATACMAAGYFTTGGFVDSTLAERWRG